MSPLDLYSRIMCRAIWAARSIFPAADDPAPGQAWTRRDYEWTAVHECENCGHKAKHSFIEWMPERVVTATCGDCNFEATL